mgnify:FL=1
MKKFLSLLVCLMLTLGLIASAYVWMSGRREEEENRKN